MLLHYRYFHPNMDFTHGWFDCCANRMVLEDGSEEDESHEEGSSNKSRLNIQVSENDTNESGVQVDLPTRSKIRLSNGGSLWKSGYLPKQVSKKISGVATIKPTSQCRGCNDFDYSGLSTQQFV